MTLAADPPQHNCRFCGRVATYAPLEEMDRYNIRVYFCHPCQAEYLFWANDDAASWSLYTTYNGRMYRWTLSVTGSAQLWHIKTPGIPGTRRNENLEFIRGFVNDIPNMTPDNFLDKLSIYLVFL